MAPLLLALRKLLHQLSDGLAGKELHDTWANCLEALSTSFATDYTLLLAGDGENLRLAASHGLAPKSHHRLTQAALPLPPAVTEHPQRWRLDLQSPLSEPFGHLLAKELTDVRDAIGIAFHDADRPNGALVLLSRTPGRFDTNDDERLSATADLLGACLRLAHRQRFALPHAFEGDGEASARDRHTHWRSPAMCRLDEAIQLVAPTSMGVLLLGETGVGKERVARQLHRRSTRHDKPFIKINCAALPEHLVESELFGHKRGAFSGAIKEHRGHFAMADGGTLMLDEIGELPLTLQPKLLRALQEGEIQPLGSEHTLKIDVRVITVTNRNLAEEVAAGRFREDLYHRLSAFPLQVPSLRERQEDIPLLAREFLEDNRIRLSLASLRLDHHAEKSLVAWHWPGNVRELEHTLSRAALRALGEQLQAQRSAAATYPRGIVTITAEHLDFSGALQPTPDVAIAETSATPEKWLALREATENFQRQYIQHALTSHENNWAATARTLAIDNGNLHRLGKRLGLK
ncbi:nitric oxide reductase transcriptional regulator NorR [Billgrantia sp. LNSP4103-1]|uniref:nitric oxide reductase transcriptional regulator NorR n=1 Tax=Billgrantia sp. LNSP4103-1 TaxID=3410266 RepID=UPI00403F43B9